MEKGIAISIIICYINYKLLLKCMEKFNGHILKYIKNKCFYKLKIKTKLHSNNETLIEIPFKDLKKNLDMPSLTNEDFLVM